MTRGLRVIYGTSAAMSPGSCRRVTVEEAAEKQPGSEVKHLHLKAVKISM